MATISNIILMGICVYMLAENPQADPRAGWFCCLLSTFGLLLYNLSDKE